MSLNLEVQILGEYKNLTKATRGATNQLKGLQSSAKRISSSINATLATIGIGLTLGGLSSGIKSVVTEASNLEQGIGAAKAVFKGFSDSVVDNSKTAANAFGLSSVQYLQSANLIGAQLSNLGFSQEEYTKKSQDLVGLGADLAATFGGTTYDAVLALSAVFRGEYNQVEKYGVAIRKSDINARVAARGQDKLTGELLKQAEATAALEILYGQTAAAQGQFQRETDTFAGAMQILRANVDNAKISIGEGFAPAITSIAEWITDNIDVFNNLTDAIGNRLKSAFEDTGDSAETFGAAIINTITDLTEFLNGTAETGNVFKDASDKLKPLTELLSAFGELTKGVITVVNGLFDGLFGWLRLIPGVDSTLGGLALVVDTIGKALQKFGYFVGFIGSLFVPFTAGFKLAANAVGLFTRGLERLQKFFKPVTDFFSKTFNKAVSNSKGRLDDVTNASDELAKAMPNVAKGTQGTVTEIKNLSTNLKIAKDNVRVYDKYLVKAKDSSKELNKWTGYARTEVTALDGAIRNLKDKTVNIKVNITGAEDRRFEALRPETIDYNARAREYGEALRASLADPIVEETNEEGTGGLTTFQKNVQKLIDTLTDSLTEARKRIRNASENFRDSVSLAFGVITNGAFAVFDINRVLRQMRRLVDGAKNFAKDIKQLQREGADQSLIDQLLGMDPLSGAATARGLLSSGRLQEFLDVRGQLADIGAGAGGVANFGILGTGTGGLSNAIESLTKTLERGYGNTYTINVNNANKMSGQEIVSAIKRYEKTAGRAVL